VVAVYLPNIILWLSFIFCVSLSDSLAIHGLVVFGLSVLVVLVA
jgi:hypothetical protein